jgi:hypothetical protein
MLPVALLFALAQEGPVPTFGTTVYLNDGLTGLIYFVQPGTPHLPKFRLHKSLGTIYTTSLNVPERNFHEGFPGVTGGVTWLRTPALTSGGGLRIYIDGKVICDNSDVAATDRQEIN